MGLFDDDIDAILTDLAVIDATASIVVVQGGDTTKGIRQTIEEVDGVGDMNRKVLRQTVVVRKGTLTTLATDAAITVDGDSFTVRDFEPENSDNRLTRIYLAAA